MHLLLLRAQEIRHFLRKQLQKGSHLWILAHKRGKLPLLKGILGKTDKITKKGRKIGITSSLEYGSSKKAEKCNPGNATALRRNGNLSLTGWIMVLLEYTALSPVPSASKQCPQTGRDFQRMWLIVKVLPGKIQASYLQQNSQIRDAVTAILPMPEQHIHKGRGGIVTNRKVLVRDQDLFSHHCYRQQEMDRNLH